MCPELFSWCVTERHRLVVLDTHAFFFKVFFVFFFACGSFLKSFLNLYNDSLCFMFWCFGHETCGILAPRLGIKPSTPALEGEVLTTGPSGKSPLMLVIVYILWLLLWKHPWFLPRRKPTSPAFQ